MTNQKEGFIVLQRKIEDWQYFNDPYGFYIWTHILIKANWKDGWFMGQRMERGSFATSYKHFADECYIGVNTIRRWLKKFEEAGQIEVKTTNRYTKIIVINYGKYQDLESEVGNQEGKQVGNQEGKQVGNQQCNKETNKQIKIEDILSGSSNSDRTASADQVIDWLNERTGSHYRHSDASRRHIVARLKEGYSVQNCRDVIDKKCVEWMNDPKMQKFLRPETLFGSKFENYLNQQVVRKESYLQRVIREETEKENEQKGDSEDSGDFGFEFPKFKYPERR